MKFCFIEDRLNFAQVELVLMAERGVDLANIVSCIVDLLIERGDLFLNGVDELAHDPTFFIVEAERVELPLQILNMLMEDAEFRRQFGKVLSLNWTSDCCSDCFSWSFAMRSSSSYFRVIGF
nr:hypothetical protein K4M19_00098 [Agrobacterium fabrum]